MAISACPFDCLGQQLRGHIAEFRSGGLAMYNYSEDDFLPTRPQSSGGSYFLLEISFIFLL
jgi:hypothetical protein